MTLEDRTFTDLKGNQYEAGSIWQLNVTTDQLDLIDATLSAVTVPAGYEDEATHLRGSVADLRAHIDSHKVEAAG